jgi:hypothetical protein
VDRDPGSSSANRKQSWLKYSFHSQLADPVAPAGTNLEKMCQIVDTRMAPALIAPKGNPQALPRMGLAEQITNLRALAHGFRE